MTPQRIGDMLHKRLSHGTNSGCKAFNALWNRQCDTKFLVQMFAARRLPGAQKMISTWSEWKRYPRAGRGENIEAPISPGIYEVRIATTGALHSFGAVDNVAQALSLLPVGAKSWFGRRDAAGTPDLEYRTCATSSKADAKTAADRMIGRRETYMSGAA
jgi:hypothetical protein